MSMAIQVMSDIHLEHQDHSPTFLKILPLCPYLFLVGDIGHISCKHWDSFWNYCSQHWKRIFVVLGNHEFYHHHHHHHQHHHTNDMSDQTNSPKIQTIDDLQKRYDVYFQKFSNITWVRYGHVAYIEEEKIHVLGATGWSNPTEKCQTLVNDFRHIYTHSDKRITPTTMGELHTKEFDWIFQYLESHPDQECIVMTHFPPIRGGVSHRHFEENEETDLATSYFRNSYDIRFQNIRTWLFGHTHYSSVQQRHKILYLSNQYGSAPYERRHTVFRMDALFLV